MHTYVLALLTGGLMEDPSRHLASIREVQADSLNAAKDEWARVTREDRDEWWNGERRTVWGWPVVCLRTTDATAEVWTKFEQLEEKGD